MKIIVIVNKYEVFIKKKIIDDVFKFIVVKEVFNKL